MAKMVRVYSENGAECMFPLDTCLFTMSNGDNPILTIRSTIPQGSIVFKARYKRSNCSAMDYVQTQIVLSEYVVDLKDLSEVISTQY